MATFDVQVITSLLSLSGGALRALHDVGAYDYVIFTSKNAERLFRKKLETLHISTQQKLRVLRVGPRSDLLKLPLAGKRVLFPRSNRAPYDIVKKLRQKGVVVHTVKLYTSKGTRLTDKQRQALLTGEVDQLYFKSPSGIAGLLKQFRGKNRAKIKSIPALCIGMTTADAAKEAGWKKVSIKR
jgi:uroporphyrinogen-III synthase